MSRSRKGKKPVGYEYWGRRKPSGLGYGKFVKLLTHRRERQQGKKEGFMDIQDEDILTEEQMQEKKEVESLLSQKLFGKKLSDIIGELEFTSQLCVVLIDYLLNLNPGTITQEKIEELKDLAAKTVNRKYGFDLLAYHPAEKEEIKEETTEF